LVDVVEEGSLSHDPESDEELEFEFEMEDSELENLAEEQIEGEKHLALEDLAELEDLEDDIEMIVDELTQDATVSELKGESGSFDSPQDLDFDLEPSSEDSASSEAEDFELEELSEAEVMKEDADEKYLGEGEPEPSIDTDFEDTTPPDMAEPVEAESEMTPSEVMSMGISEDKIEAIVREVVEDVVGRVARETMAEVAEKVIREAIDALKQSLESLSE